MKLLLTSAGFVTDDIIETAIRLASLPHGGKLAFVGVAQQPSIMASLAMSR